MLVARRDREYASSLRRQEQEAEQAERMRELPFGVTDYS